MVPDPTLVLAFAMPGGMEWLIILVIALLLFGRRLPGIMRSLGSSAHQFSEGMRGETPPPPADAPPKE